MRSSASYRREHKRLLPVVATALLTIAVMSLRTYGAETPADKLERMARARFGELSAAEVILLRSAPQRQIQWAGPIQDPDDPRNNPEHAGSWGAERTIRGELLSWLCSDPESTRLVHPSGAGIVAAKIVGAIDLSYQTVPFPLSLIRCAIPDGIDFSNGRLKGLDLRASITGPISLQNASIGGDLGLTFGSYGPINLYRANIDGTVDLSSGRIQTGGTSLSAVEATVTGDLLFHQGFTTDGLIDLRLAHIGHALSFNDARFVGDQDTGLDAERAVIDGPLYWVSIALTARTELDLEDARVSTLWDDEPSWPKTGNLILAGFEYSEFGAECPDSAASRLRWLARQPPGYNPQPYAELAKALRGSGRLQDSIDVEIAMRVAQRRQRGTGAVQRAWNALLQYTIGYGFLPLRALWWIAGFVLIGTILFGWGYFARVVVPTEEQAYRAFVKTGSTPPHYPAFNAFVYSLENFLPVVELHQGEYWRPNPRLPDGIESGDGPYKPEDDEKQPSYFAYGHSFGGRVLRWYLWVHIVAGWILTPLLAAGLTGLIKVE